jgi:hypothetical protein
MKVTLLLSTSGLDESAGTPEPVQLLLVGVFGEASNCSDETPAPDRVPCAQMALISHWHPFELEQLSHNPRLAASDRTDAAIAKPETPFGRVDTRGMDPR